MNDNFDTRPIRPAHDFTIDRSDILSAAAFTRNDPASRGVERVMLVVIVLLIAAAVIVQLVR